MLMIIGAGPMQIPAIRIAQEMKLRTLVTDYNPDAPGLALADVPVVMSTKDIEGSVRTARQYEHMLRGVMTVGTDASLTVAAVAGALGLPGIHYDAAENATHKVKMRRTLKAAGVAVPEFAAAWTIDEARAMADRIGFPLVMKPVDNMGARGVMRVDNMTGVEPAFRHAKSCSTSGEVILEKFVEGPELSIDALVWDGRILCTGTADRIIARPPHFIELGHTLPSSLPAADQAAAVAELQKAVTALGITFGAAKGDVKVSPQGPVIGECAARLSGGWMSSHTFPLSSGWSMIRGAIEIAIGRKPEVPPFLSKVAMERAVIATPGRIIRIEGVANARRIPGVVDVIVKGRVGDSVSAPTSNMDKQAHVIAAADTAEECEAVIRRALEAIRIETKTERVLSLADYNARARNAFGKWCRACRVCDGVFCAGMVPGMGGIGTGQSFFNNLSSLARWRLRERLVHDVRSPRLVREFLGIELALPVLGAPVTGAVTNMGGATTEEEFAEAMVEGARLAGTIACVGDGATPEKYRIGLDAAARSRGRAIPIFKPRSQDEVRARIRAAVAAGCPAVGMDIDGAAFVTMKSRGQSVGPKTEDEIRALVESSEVPFLVKGIMDPRDAEAVVRAGARGIIVGNHGGRVLDHMPGGADALPAIASAVGGDVVVILDGGVRSGEDVLKGLALGADLCMIGRPVAIAAVGGGVEAVELYWRDLREQIERAMILTGMASVDAVDASILHGDGSPSGAPSLAAG